MLEDLARVNAHLLLVDDEPKVLSALQCLLRHETYQGVTAQRDTP
ncbi:hypothetical protein [Vreelandella rituensis]|nr:hypothetical protein [Halomonas rituensis]